jgi:hypothetical protein
VILPPAEIHQLDPEQRARKPARIAAWCFAGAVVIAGVGWILGAST